MPVINLKILINADIHTVFDLSRSIDLHSISTAKTNEKAIAGVTSGLIKAGETVTWEATHFGIRQTLTSKITAFEEPFHFRDEMLQGTFKYIRHARSITGCERNPCVMSRIISAFSGT